MTTMMYYPHTNMILSEANLTPFVLCDEAEIPKASALTDHKWRSRPAGEILTNNRRWLEVTGVGTDGANETFLVQLLGRPKADPGNGVRPLARELGTLTFLLGTLTTTAHPVTGEEAATFAFDGGSNITAPKVGDTVKATNGRWRGVLSAWNGVSTGTLKIADGVGDFIVSDNNAFKVYRANVLDPICAAVINGVPSVNTSYLVCDKITGPTLPSVDMNDYQTDNKAGALLVDLRGIASIYAHLSSASTNTTRAIAVGRFI